MMNSPLPILTFSYRTQACSECDGDRFIAEPARWAGEAYGEWVDVPCHACSDGTEPVLCKGCEKATALDDDDLCRDCSSFVTIDLTPMGGGTWRLSV